METGLLTATQMYHETFNPIYKREIKLLIDSFRSTVVFSAYAGCVLTSASQSSGKGKDGHRLFNEAFSQMMGAVVPVILDEQVLFCH